MPHYHGKDETGCGLSTGETSADESTHQKIKEVISMIQEELIMKFMEQLAATEKVDHAQQLLDAVNDKTTDYGDLVRAACDCTEEELLRVFTEVTGRQFSEYVDPTLNGIEYEELGVEVGLKLNMLRGHKDFLVKPFEEKYELVMNTKGRNEHSSLLDLFSTDEVDAMVNKLGITYLDTESWMRSVGRKRLLILDKLDELEQSAEVKDAVSVEVSEPVQIEVVNAPAIKAPKTRKGRKTMSKITIEQAVSAVQSATTATEVQTVLEQCKKDQLHEVFLAVTDTKADLCANSWRKSEIVSHYVTKIIAFRARDVFKKMDTKARAEYLLSQQYKQDGNTVDKLLWGFTPYELIALNAALGVSFEEYKDIHEGYGIMANLKYCIRRSVKEAGMTKHERVIEREARVIARAAYANVATEETTAVEEPEVETVQEISEPQSEFDPMRNTRDIVSRMTVKQMHEIARIVKFTGFSTFSKNGLIMTLPCRIRHFMEDFYDHALVVSKDDIMKVAEACGTEDLLFSLDNLHFRMNGRWIHFNENHQAERSMCLCDFRQLFDVVNFEAEKYERVHGLLEGMAQAKMREIRDKQARIDYDAVFDETAYSPDVQDITVNVDDIPADHEPDIQEVGVSYEDVRQAYMAYEYAMCEYSDSRDTDVAKKNEADTAYREYLRLLVEYRKGAMPKREMALRWVRKHFSDKWIPADELEVYPQDMLIEMSHACGIHAAKCQHISKLDMAVRLLRDAGIDPGLKTDYECAVNLRKEYQRELHEVWQQRRALRKALRLLGEDTEEARILEDMLCKDTTRSVCPKRIEYMLERYRKECRKCAEGRRYEADSRGISPAPVQEVKPIVELKAPEPKVQVVLVSKPKTKRVYRKKSSKTSRKSHRPNWVKSPQLTPKASRRNANMKPLVKMTRAASTLIVKKF